MLLAQDCSTSYSVLHLDGNFNGLGQVNIIMMSSPAGLQQGQFNFLSQWMPDSSRAGVLLHGSPGEAGSGSVRSSGSLVVQDPDDSFSCQFAPLPPSLSSSCASVDVCSPSGGGKTLRETVLFDASLNSEMQSIQDVLRNTRDLPLIAKLEQLKQMQHRMQEQLKAHQQEQLLRLQHEPQRLVGKAQNTAETTGWNQEQSVVELNTGNEDSDHDYQESIQSTIEDQTMYRKECDSEPQDRPIKSGFGGRTFEEILEEQLKMEDQKLMGKNAPAESVKVKRPFLKRGEGLARFTRGKATVPPVRKSPPNHKPSLCPNPKVSQDLDMRSNKNSVKNKTEGSKFTHPVIQRKTAVLNKENILKNKTTAPVTKMTVQPRVLVGHQSENMNPIPAQFQPKSDPSSKQKINSVTTTDSNKEGSCSGVEDNARVAENSFEVWFTERKEHWEQDHQRECAELGEFELLERAADEISFSSNSSFISTLLQRDRRRLSSTPIKSTSQSALPSHGQGPAVTPEPMLGHSVPVPPTNTTIQRDVISIGPKEQRGFSEEETNEKLDDDLLCSNSGLQPLPNMSNPPITHCFEVPTTLPYDKLTYQDRDGASSPEEDERNLSNNGDSTLIDSRAQLEFDDDDTWNEPEEESCCPAEESPSDRALKRKVAFSKGVKPAGGSPHAVGNRKEAPPTCQLVSKLFPALKPKPFPPVTVVHVQEPQNVPSEEGAGNAQSRLLRERLVELETEIERFKSENAALAKLKQENQDIRENLKKERAEFEKRMEEIAKWEELKREEHKKLQRERTLFEKHAATVRARPDKQERDEIQALQQQLNVLQEDLCKREARWSNTQSRLRQQVNTLSAENAALRDQVRTQEKLRLSAWKSAEKEKEKGKFSLSGKRTNTGSKCTDSRSPSQSSKNSSSSRKGSPETQIPLTNSAFFPEQVKESISFKYEPSPVETQCSDGLVTTERNHDAPHNSLSGIEKSEKEQEEITQSDNKIEKVLPDGGRLVVFPNGTRKELSADGQMVKVMFFNGDVKHTMPDQRVIYYYAEAQTTHITYPDGMEVLQFPNNQTEKHFPDGRKEITFPDQMVKTLYPDGREESVLTDGTIIQLNPDGSKVIQFNTGQREIHTADFKRREYPDGTVKTVYSDGRQETQYPTGRVRLKDAQGHVIMNTKA
ncbi:centromere protein J-like isoform X3 [Sinocyclocheilus anshuiensis]|uniref:centromere protein J-like isoform X3 n=1 Tax=Sinocyclocheilus anshuiensis TaxID=1608454 RepID=UPI0007BAD212|nr:PREDICTED: centromere protein J-like isoform X3 [Sinocyclocheilus anshuiensis]